MITEVSLVPQSRHAIPPKSRFYRSADCRSEELLADVEKRGCGSCCAVAAIHALTGKTVTVDSFHETMRVREGFSERGAIHHRLAELISEFGPRAHAAPFSSEAIRSALSDAMFICSVGYKFPVEGCGGHLVLLHGWRGNHFAVMGPSGWGADHRMIQIKRFFASYAGRVIKVQM